MLVAANYHYIRPRFEAPYPGIFGVTPEQFESQLSRLGKIASFVSAADIVNALEEGHPLQGNALLITFDDGLREQFEFALPILDKMGIPAVFYINTINISESKISLVHKIHLLFSNLPFEEYSRAVLENAASLFGKTIELENSEAAVKHYNFDTPDRAVLKYFLNFCLDFQEQSSVIDLLFEKTFPGSETKIREDLYMTRDNIIELGNLGYLGSHSHRHIPLGLYPDEVIDKDISSSIKILNDITGHKPVTISYPYGSVEAVGEVVQRKAKDNGLKFGFTMHRAGNLNLMQPMGLSRFDCNDLPGGKASIFKDEDFFAGISHQIIG